MVQTLDIFNLANSQDCVYLGVHKVKMKKVLQLRTVATPMRSQLEV